jgi:hypothetical protein
MLFAYANAICVALTVGIRSNRVPPAVPPGVAAAANTLNAPSKIVNRLVIANS